MSDARLSKRALLFRSFTGLEISEFDSIYEDIESREPANTRESVFPNARDKEVLVLADPSKH